MRGYPDVRFEFPKVFVETALALDPDNNRLKEALARGTYLGFWFRVIRSQIESDSDQAIVDRLFNEYRQITAKPYDPAVAKKRPYGTPRDIWRAWRNPHLTHKEE